MKNRPLSVDEFCELVGICRTTAYGHIRAGRLRAVKLGRKTLLPDVENFLANLPGFQPRAGDRFGLERAAELAGETKAKGEVASKTTEAV